MDPLFEETPVLWHILLLSLFETVCFTFMVIASTIGQIFSLTYDSIYKFIFKDVFILF